jgi:ribosome-binding protein aMBF1 (putative translation factor)
MRVIDKSRDVDISINGKGVAQFHNLIRTHYPEAEIQTEDEDQAVQWDTTELAKEIKAKKTPGKLLQAYRLREGMTLVQLAEKVGTKYPNLSAMEHDRRMIGLTMAKKLSQILNVDYKKFLD